ncbi:hypothetical protein [Nocardioides coralli]|uniref:hypothetical protein n=1 Tax=Nocardioides coralli TaxID=2872154 RepID=UPI001CA3ABEE|nr:hypothetical protein [Nocardioides coralli]QZY28150.1 hypothetical protein K6T13_11710 [Nocardioides coralli]
MNPPRLRGRQTASPSSGNTTQDLVLHIGTGKTGTSSLQAFLHQNRDHLVAHGVLYPRAPGSTRHTRFGLYIKPDQALLSTPSWKRAKAATPAEFRRRFERELLAEIADAGTPRVLVSDEALYGMPAAAMRRLRDFAESHGWRSTIVCYLRRQDDHLVSRYQQVVKVGETRRLAERTRAMDLSETYDYHARLDLWEEVLEPASVVVRRFERDSMLGGSLFQDFLDAVGVDAGVDELEPVTERNVSLDAEAVEFLRLLNLHRVEREGAVPGHIDNRQVAARLAEASTGPTLTLPDDLLDEFMSQWEESNRKVATRYLADSSGVLFRSPRKDSGTTSLQRLDPSRVGHLLEVAGVDGDLREPLCRLIDREDG